MTITNEAALARIDPTADCLPILKHLNSTYARSRLSSCESEASAAWTMPACAWRREDREGVGGADDAEAVPELRRSI